MRRYELLELRYDFGGMEQTLCPVVLPGETGMALVDCGYPGSVSMLEEALDRQGLDPTRITHLILTHQDDDHMGAAAQWLEKYPATRVLASAAEAPYLEGRRKNLRLAQAEELQATLPEDQKAFGEQFCARYRALRPVPISRLLRAGDVLPFGGGVAVLETPGHTPGHISLRALDNSYLVTGDAAVVEDGTLAVANPGFCLDLPTAERSLAALLDYACPAYLCCHGGVFQRNGEA